MSAHSLVIPFAAPDGMAVEERWWLRLVPEEATANTATVGEVAGLVDRLYGIEPCDGEQDHRGGEEMPVAEDGTTEPPVDEDEFVDIVRDEFDFSICDVDPDDGSYEAAVRVYRSHLSERYRLVVVNGRVVRTVRVEDTIRTVVTVDKASSVDLPGPVKGALSASWSGVVYDDNGPVSLPEITLRGSTVSFGRAVTGMLSVGYRTEYDLVTVHVDGLDGEPQDGAMLAFYHGMVIEGTVGRPDGDDQVDRSLCSSSTRYHDDEKPICYKLVHRLTKCQCSEQEVSRETVRVEVQCPDGSLPGEHLDGSETVTVARVDCGEETGDIADPSFYEQTCCEPPDFSLPRCSRRVTVFRGGKGIDGGVQKYRSLYGDSVRLVAVSPADGICGEVVTEQIKIPRNCCDEATPITWDHVNSTEVIADGSSGIVTVSGGRPPYSWSVRGAGFYADDSLVIRDVQTMVPWLRVHTAPGACGTCSISVTDGCSSASGDVRSTIGQWVQISAGGIWNPVPGAMAEWTNYASDIGSKRVEGVAVSGRYKVKEVVSLIQPSSYSCQDVASTCQSYAGGGISPVPQLGGYPYGWPCADLIPGKYVFCEQVASYDVWEWQC